MSPRPRQEAIDLATAFVTDLGIRYESLDPVIHHDALGRTADTVFCLRGA
jgi:hypothetical protein